MSAVRKPRPRMTGEWNPPKKLKSVPQIRGFIHTRFAGVIEITLPATGEDACATERKTPRRKA